jgi:hypothetical protein
MAEDPPPQKGTEPVRQWLKELPSGRNGAGQPECLYAVPRQLRSAMGSVSQNT